MENKPCKVHCQCKYTHFGFGSSQGFSKKVAGQTVFFCHGCKKIGVLSLAIARKAMATTKLGV